MAISIAKHCPCSLPPSYSAQVLQHTHTLTTPLKDLSSGVSVHENQLETTNNSYFAARTTLEINLK